MDACVVSGGGVRGVALLGAAGALQDLGFLGRCRTFVGTSSGALVCTVLATGSDPRGAMEVIARNPYKPDFDLGGLAARMRFGLDTGKNFEAWVCGVVGRGRLSPKTTFEDIRRQYGSELVVVATDVSARKAVYFGPRTHPGMRVVKALRMSCSVPILFSAVEWQGRVYADGALVDNFALQHAVGELGSRRPLGICATKGERDVTSEHSSLDVYMASLIDCVTHAYRSPVPACATVLDVDAGGLSMSMSPGEAAVRELYASGQGQARLFAKKIV
jgi:predicted acylesterase/phospholipase RssA